MRCYEKSKQRICTPAQIHLSNFFHKVRRWVNPNPFNLWEIDTHLEKIGYQKKRINQTIHITK